VRLRRFAVPAGALVLLAAAIAGWELAVRLADVPRYLLPAPSDIAGALSEHRSRLAEDALVTGGEMLAGFALALVAGLAAAVAMVLLRVLRVEQAYRAVNWTTVVLVAAMIPVSTAMVQTGAADLLARHLVAAVGDAGPYALLLGLFVLTAALGQLISNMATALIVIPIALSAATELGVSARPVLMAVTVAAAAALLTPVATPVNMMVMEPGGYRFGDYWKLGLPIMVLYLAVAVFLVPLFWPFR
jgi:di/tricarboxylate transporter